MEKTAYRHGDVIIVPATIPAEAKEVKAEKIVLALGEVTGHSHQITKGAGQLFKFDEKTYLKVTKRATLSHEEHKALQLPAGDYEVIIQNEYQPMGWQKVQD